MAKQTKKRIGPVNDLAGVTRELGRIYRECRRNELPLADGTRLATILRELRCAFESRDVEQRLKELEGRL